MPEGAEKKKRAQELKRERVADQEAIERLTRKQEKEVAQIAKANDLNLAKDLN
jgi:hypothetical protein